MKEYSDRAKAAMEAEETSRPDDKLEAGDVTQSSPLLRWLDNFWYHYKWPTIIIAFFVIVGSVCIFQMLNRTAYDAHFIYAGSYRLDGNADEPDSHEREDFIKLLNRICPKDFDGNGEKMINLQDYQIYSEQEAADEKAELESAAVAEGEKPDYYFNTQFNKQELDNMNSFLMNGECSVCLVSPYLFEMLCESDRVRPLSEVYGEDAIPDTATENGYGICFGETDLYRYNPEAQVLPDNLVLCIMYPLVNTDEYTYQCSTELFRAMTDYDVAE